MSSEIATPNHSHLVRKSARRSVSSTPVVIASAQTSMLTKYSMLVCALAITTGVLLTDLRADLRTKWLWFGVAISLLIFLPNLVWQIQDDFVSIDFLRHIHERDVRIGRTKDFLPDQLKLT